jgi:hypothetical protein
MKRFKATVFIDADSCVDLEYVADQLNDVLHNLGVFAMDFSLDSIEEEVQVHEKDDGS